MTPSTKCTSRCSIPISCARRWPAIPTARCGSRQGHQPGEGARQRAGARCSRSRRLPEAASRQRRRDGRGPHRRPRARASAASNGASMASRRRLRPSRRAAVRPTPSPSSWRSIPATTSSRWSPTTPATCWPRCRAHHHQVHRSGGQSEAEAAHPGHRHQRLRRQGMGAAGIGPLAFAPLGLAVKDAEAFGASMKKAAAGLYGEVRVTLALDKEATRDNLDKARRQDRRARSIRAIPSSCSRPGTARPRTAASI